jgi:hypothetical protein
VALAKDLTQLGDDERIRAAVRGVLTEDGILPPPLVREQKAKRPSLGVITGGKADEE